MNFENYSNEIVSLCDPDIPRIARYSWFSFNTQPFLNIKLLITSLSKKLRCEISLKISEILIFWELNCNSSLSL